MRRHKTREERIAAVVQAWEDLPNHGVEPELMTLVPDLYFAVAWLAASETVRNERNH